MYAFFTAVFYQPLYNLLIWLHNISPYNDMGIAIVVITILIRFALYPLNKNSIVAQKKLQDIQPKVNELKEKYKDSKEEQAKKLLELYKEHKINPFSSCLPLLIQLPFIFAIFEVFRNGLTSTDFSLLYPFVAAPEHINVMTLGFFDLSTPSFVLAGLAGIAQYFATKNLIKRKPVVEGEESKDEKMAASMNKQMAIYMPILTVVFGVTLPAGLTLYWLLTTLLMIHQQARVYKQMEKQAQGSAS